MSLLSAADYLLMDIIKQYYFEFLESNITSDNCFIVFNASILYENKSLEKKLVSKLAKTLTQLPQKKNLNICLRTY